MTDLVFLHQVSKKYAPKELAKEIHAKAAPFVKWLKEAEEESEGSEEEEQEDDENVEVTYSSNVCVVYSEQFNLTHHCRLVAAAVPGAKTALYINDPHMAVNKTHGPTDKL